MRMKCFFHLIYNKFKNIFTNSPKTHSVSFLFGAGISKPSGLPLAKDLLADILKNENAILNDRLLCVINFVKSSLKTDNYEDIYSVLKSLRLYCDGMYRNPATILYLENLKKYIEEMNSYSVVDACNMICDHIDKVLCQKLKVDSRKIKGVDILKQLSRYKHIKTIDIFTLNHDTILDIVLSDNVSDGFERLEQGLYIFSNKWNKKIRLHKLHGSIDWRPLYSEKQKKYIPGRFDLSRENIDITTSYLKYGYKYQSDYSKILTGTAIKEFEYNFGIYATLFNLFFLRLNQTKRLFISGYGWNDSVINLRILDWLQRSQENKLIIIHNKNEDLYPTFVNKTFSKVAWGENKVLFLNKWLSETTIDDIKQYL